MTHHDKAPELVDELRLIGCHANGDSRCTCVIGQEAADIITALAEENQRLREALERIEAASKFWSEYPDGNDAIRYAHESTHRLARAALSSTGEKG